MLRKQKLSSRMEDYLEAIAMLEKKGNGIVRIRDISNFLNVKKPTVNSALNNLSQKGLIIHERYGYVELTRQGKNLARYVQKKHNMLIKFLSNVLNIDYEIAKKDACKMEHTLSPQTFMKLTKFIEFIETCPDGQRPDWLKSFDYYFKTGKRRKSHIRKIKGVLE